MGTKSNLGLLVFDETASWLNVLAPKVNKWDWVEKENSKVSVLNQKKIKSIELDSGNSLFYLKF